MGAVCFPQDTQFARPPIPRPDERGQGGRVSPSISALSRESEEGRHSWIAAVEKLVAYVFEIAVKRVGRTEAERLFAQIAKKPQKKGKQPNHDRNRLLLEMYDRALREAPEREKSAPRRVAYQLYYSDYRSEFHLHSVEAIEKQIRRLVNHRNRWPERDGASISPSATTFT